MKALELRMARPQATAKADPMDALIHEKAL
jgi:hypothetical protein